LAVLIPSTILVVKRQKRQLALSATNALASVMIENFFTESLVPGAFIRLVALGVLGFVFAGGSSIRCAAL
jgi:hypothetical protein